MMRKPLLVFMIILLFSVTFVFPNSKAVAKARTIDVPGDFSSIQAAINDASDGDTVFVHEGLYKENVVANKTVSLIGENKEKTVIDGNGSGITLMVAVDRVSVSSFTVRGGGSNVYESGVFVAAFYSNITDNIVDENGLFGIYLNSSSSSYVSGNVIRRNKADGIILSNSFSNTVFGNTIAENRVGIHLYGSDQNYILNNTLEGNSVGGINLFYSSSNYLDSNDLIGNNGTGMILDFSSSNNALNGNMIAFTIGYGLTVGSGPNNVLRNNNLTANTYNFYCQAVSPNLSDFLNDIDSSNTVNGRPIYYFVNREGLVINSSNLKNAGYLALVNCAYITVDGMSFSENGQGLLLAFTSNTTLRDLKTAKNHYGIQLLSSVDNTLTNNTLLDNYDDGITLDYSSINNTVTYNTITSSSNAIRMAHHISQCYIVGNLMANSAKGLWMYSYDDQNIIIDNVLTNNTQGIWMQSACSSNIIAQNTISDNAEGLHLNFCPYNLIFHNNFVNNTVQVVSSDSTNTWDFNYEGNYWSNYTGADLNHDGIGDASHAVDADNTDRYPLIGTFYDFEVTWENGDTDHVQVVSNSTISNFTVLHWLSSPNQHLQPGQKYISFFITGQDNTSGFCRVFIPRSVLNGTYIVLVDWQETPASELEASNTTHAYLYFTYEHSTHEVIIVPEFAPALTILMFIIATTSGAIACRRKRLHATSQRLLFKERKLDRELRK